MAVSRTTSEAAGDELIRIYSSIEARITAEMARRLANGMGTPDWATNKLAATQSLIGWTRRLLDGLDKKTQAAAATAILDAGRLGREAALDEMERWDTSRTKRLIAAGREAMADGATLPGQSRLARLADDLANRLESTRAPILRWVADTYREVIGRVAAVGVLSGLDTRRQASEAAWNAFLDKGITGFTDVRGRRWTLASYVEMATRSAVVNATVDAHDAQLGTLGVEYVVVSDAPQECKLCRPWEGKILTRTGTQGAHQGQGEHATQDGKMVTFQVAGSLEEARRAGLFHPNCRHRVSAYLPGLTEVPTHTADPEGDAARQKLRGLEREIRRNKIKENAALTPAGKKAAGQKVKDLQGKIRAHLAEHEDKGLFRRSDREQINLGNKRRGQGPTGPTSTGPKKPKPTPTKKAPPAKKPARQPGQYDDDFQAVEISRTTKDHPLYDYHKQQHAQTERDYADAKDRQRRDRKQLEATPGGMSDYERQYMDDQEARTKKFYEGHLQRHKQGMEDHKDKGSTIVKTKLTGTPGKERVADHVDTATARLTGTMRTQVKREAGRQGDLTPKSMMQLQGVHAPETPEELRVWAQDGKGTASAYYRFATSGPGEDAATRIRQITMSPDWMDGKNTQEAVWQRSASSNWTVPNGAPTHMEGTFSHEFGHHISNMIFDRSSGAAANSKGRDLLAVVRDQIGVTLDVNAVNPYQELMRVVAHNPTVFEHKVSKYGSSHGEEFLAEVWHEYSTKGANARPWIRAIGDVMKRLAEDGAFDLK